jgi:hypothetical protein
MLILRWQVVSTWVHVTGAVTEGLDLEFLKRTTESLILPHWGSQMKHVSGHVVEFKRSKDKIKDKGKDNALAIFGSYHTAHDGTAAQFSMAQ